MAVIRNPGRGTTSRKMKNVQSKLFDHIILNETWWSFHWYCGHNSCRKVDIENK